MVKKYLRLVIIAVITFSCTQNHQKTETIISAVNESNTIKAEIIKITTEENTSMLTEGEYYLRFINLGDSTVVSVEGDLLAGQGGYESGIKGISWLDSNNVLIERYLYDRKHDLIFNIHNMSMKKVEQELQ